MILSRNFQNDVCQLYDMLKISKREVETKERLFSVVTFHTQRPGNYSIYLSGQNFFSCYTCQENLTKYPRDRQTEAKVLRLFSTATQ